jgi:hypothetical protein
VELEDERSLSIAPAVASTLGVQLSLQGFGRERRSWCSLLFKGKRHGKCYCLVKKHYGRGGKSEAASAIARRCSTSVGADEQSLVSWVREQGGRVGALQQRHSRHGGWGLRTTDAVRVGESLIALPSHLPLSVQTSDPLLLALFDRIPVRVVASGRD